MATMADIIARGRARGWASEDIAAAVAAHMESPEVIETMARAWCRHECSEHEDKVEGARCIPNCMGTWRELVPAARAAISAALGEYEGVGRG